MTAEPVPAVHGPSEGQDRPRAEIDVETAVYRVLSRNPRLRGDHIVATAGAEGLLTLTGSVATQELSREVELSCWTVPGVWSLHNRLVVGRS